MEKREPSSTVGGNGNWETIRENGMVIPQKTINRTSLWRCNPPRAYTHPETNMSWNDTCMPMFTAALPTTARTWKPPRCASTEERVKKTRSICRMEYYAAMKKNGVMPFAATWTDLDMMILNEVSQREGEIPCGVTHVWDLILEKW